MREIKFRFWTEKGSGMVSWEDVKKECDRLSLLEMDGFIPMQYTGLKDKNGKEIYEGDIIHDNTPRNNVNRVIKWIPDWFTWWAEIADAYGVKRRNYLHEYTEYDNEARAIQEGVCYLKNKSIEIIGNIYENPEFVNKEVNHEGR